MRPLALAVLLAAPAAADNCPPGWVEDRLAALCAAKTVRSERLQCLRAGETACFYEAMNSRVALKTTLSDPRAHALALSRARAHEENLRRLDAALTAAGEGLGRGVRDELASLNGAIATLGNAAREDLSFDAEPPAAAPAAAPPFVRAKRRGPQDDSEPRLSLKAAVALAAVFALFITAALLWWGPDESGEGLPMYGSPPLPGQTIAGKWRLRARLPGPGAPLYRAKDLKTGAARLVRGPLPVPVTDILRPVEAAAAAAKLTHPALVDLFETGREVRGVFVAGEDLSGQTLEEALARSRALDDPFARRLAAQTAAALARLHEDGFVHGGFAPRWVLLREDGTIKLRGFGPCPDPSPEEYREPGGRVPDRATDQYAWAAVVYRMLSGAPPFGGADGGELKNEPGGCPSPARHRAGLPPALDGFFRLALDPDPDRRFDSMTAAAAAFEACWPLPAPQNAKMGA